MPSRRSERGVSLIEAMVAMVILLVGALGMMTLHSTGLRLQNESREVTRATAIAQDLMNQLQSWEYADTRLVNASPANDADVGDDARLFEASGPPPYDHAEVDLTAGGATWTGIPTASLATGGFERYWNVSTTNPATGNIYDSNSNNQADGMHVAVIVRWPQGGRWHRIALHGFKVNPEDRL